MRKSPYLIVFLLLMAVFHPVARAQSGGRFLVLNFDCYGEAAGKSRVIGDSLRHYMAKSGVSIVSRDLVSKLIARKGLDESDLNYVLKNLKVLMGELNAGAAIYGHVLSSHDILTVELRLIEENQLKPVLFDPIVCGRLQDIYKTIPRMAELILSPDKSAPLVLSVEPSPGEQDVQQYVEMTVTFSKPMNPATYSLAGYPESMWKRYGEVTYIDSTCTYIFKLHLYPDIEYEFHVNGTEAKGFKDERGNVAPEYVWKFTTGHW
ncbi:MAG: Ig-like domain-containing protein [Candidatus Zixiibacteriota bacterium]|nr:MAG: Ig-like domain-containing protein [candidate division Zixibacteria bacterium]